LSFIGAGVGLAGIGAVRLIFEQNGGLAQAQAWIVVAGVAAPRSGAVAVCALDSFAEME
jgi:hypothetical protein